LIAFLYLWLKFWEGIDKYWIVPVRKLFYFHHWLLTKWIGRPHEFALRARFGPQAVVC